MKIRQGRLFDKPAFLFYAGNAGATPRPVRPAVPGGLLPSGKIKTARRMPENLPRAGPPEAASAA